MIAKNKVSYCIITFPHIGEINFTQSLNMSITYNPVLDETLDTATIRLTDLRQADYPLINISKAFEAFSLVRIGFVGQNTEIRMLIAQDTAKRQRKDDTAWNSWSHTIQLVEETKQLERESVDVLTFTNPVERKYDATADAQWMIVENSVKGLFVDGPSSNVRLNGWELPSGFKMYYQKGTRLSFNNNSSKFDYVNTSSTEHGVHIFNKKIISYLNFYLTNPTGRTRKLTSDISGNIEIVLDKSGEYILSIDFKWYEHAGGGAAVTSPTYYTYSFETYIAAGNIENLIKNYTVKDILDRTLNLTPTRTNNPDLLPTEQNKYKFDSVQLAEYSEEAPEFAFTGHTLFEAMLQIAGYKGAFPKMRTDNSGNKIISFRSLWNGKWITATDLKAEPIDEISCSDINQYCTYLETEVQNLVGLNESRKATLIEPYANGYKTTRSSAGSEISEDTVIISTDYNIYQSIALNMGNTHGQDVGNISAYVYEEGEYEALSDTNGAYPNSKGYAIKWSQMGRNYTELAHRIYKVDNVKTAFERPAISNILYAITGDSGDSSLMTYLAKLVGVKDKDTFAELMFRSEYIPIFNARVKQYKDYFGEFHHDGSIKYNQTAELVDSEMYGEHLKQLIRKIGNATKRCVYIFDKIDDVPEVGTVVDGYSVYDVQMSIRENEVIATISYVKYAELSQYIGVKNAWKDSDVSSNKCYNRFISINEFLLFSHKEINSSSKSISNQALEKLTKYTSSSPLTCVEATGYMNDGSKLNTVLLPVISLAVGNSLFFQWKYEDNYSAGYMSETAPAGATNALSGTKYNRAQKAVRYCDMYGRMETYDFSIMPSGPVPDGKNMIWIEGVTEADYLETEVQVTNYPGTVELTYTRNYRIGMYISEAYPVDIIVKFSVTTTEETIICTDIIPAGMVSISSTKSFKNKVSYELISATCYDISDKTCYISAADVSRRIGYSLPLKPPELRKASDLSQWKGEDYIAVKNLLVEKNSSEALTFSVQLHYCADNENFIIGSGLTNFCSLVGGEAQQTGLFGFNERINVFKRRFSVSNATRLGDIIFTVNNSNRRIEITLPSTINNYEAWAFMGKDKNGNWQIIFGENRDLEGSDFKTGLYLLPMHKLEDFV